MGIKLTGRLQLPPTSQLKISYIKYEPFVSEILFSPIIGSADVIPINTLITFSAYPAIVSSLYSWDLDGDIYEDSTLPEPEYSYVSANESIIVSLTKIDTSETVTKTLVTQASDVFAKSFKYSAGMHSAAIIDDEGKLWVCGNNPGGHLGTGDTTARNVFVRASTTATWKSVAVVGRYHPNTGAIIAIKSDGTMWSVGDSEYNGRSPNSSQVFVQVGSKTDWVKVASSFEKCLAIDSVNDLYLISSTVSLISNTKDWVDIAVGENYSGGSFFYAVASDGTLWSWGNNAYGQLGHGDYTPKTLPTQVGTSVDWKYVFAGSNAAYAIKTDGTLWGCGRNVPAETGGYNNYTIFKKVDGGYTDWSFVGIFGAEETSVLAARKNGSVYCWGYNGSYDLGINNNITPINTVYLHPYFKHPSAIFSGMEHGTFVLTNHKNKSTMDRQYGGKTVYLNHAGRNWSGFFFTENSANPIPKRTNFALNGEFDKSFEYFDGKISVFCSGNNSHTMVIKDNVTSYEIVGTGANYNGQLGTGNYLTMTTFANAVGISSYKPIKLATSKYATAAILLSGTSDYGLWGTGKGGLNGISGIDINLFNRIGSDQNWKDIKAGYDFFIAQNSSNQLFSWGFNTNGQLGDNTTISRNTPVSVDATGSFINYSLGRNYAAGIKSDNSLWVWGNGSDYKLGTGSISDVLKPTQIGTSTNWNKVFCGFNSTYAINQTGEIYGVGKNILTTLTTLSDTTTFTLVPLPFTDVFHIIPMEDGVLAFRKNGECYWWGPGIPPNYFGELGGTGVYRSHLTINFIGYGTPSSSRTKGIFIIRNHGLVAGSGEGAYGDGLSFNTKTVFTNLDNVFTVLTV